MAITFVSAGAGCCQYNSMGDVVTVTLPTSYSAGDMFVAVIAAYGGAGDSITSVPSGWSLATSIVDSSHNSMIAVYTKIATASEPTNYIWCTSLSSEEVSGAILAYSGATAVDVCAAVVGSAGSVTAPSVTTTSANDMILYCYQFGNVGTTGVLPSGITSRINFSFYYSQGIMVGDLLQASIGATPTETGTSSATGANGMTAVTLALRLPFNAPSAPTLLSPVNASYDDVSSGETFSAGYNSTDNYSQNAYALRIKVSGASSYSYFNASTNALQSTIVWNADSVVVGGDWAVTLPSGLLANGNIYNWSMASQESVTNLQGPFASDFTFTANAAPTVVVTAPSGVETGTTNPFTVWTGTFSGSTAQTDYQVIIESGTYSSVPGSGTQVWNSGVVASAVTSVATTTTLAPNITYRSFVQLTGTGGELSSWGYSTFTIKADVPAVPLFTAVPGFDPTTGSPLVTLTLQGQDNQLTLNQASLESNVTTGWAAGSNTTIATSSAWAQDGSYSLALTATAAGAVSASTPTGTSGVACSPGQVVRAMGSFHSPTTARACTVAITFYNSAGSVISTLTSTSVNSTLTGNGGQAFITGTAPALTASMSLTINGAGLSASELLYADCMFLGPGSSSTWTTGGFVGGTVANLTFSDDGVNWFAVRNGTGLTIPTANQTVSLADYEGSLGFTRQYKAQVVF